MPTKSQDASAGAIRVNLTVPAYLGAVFLKNEDRKEL